MSDIEDVAAELAAKIEAELQVPVYVGGDIAAKKSSGYFILSPEVHEDIQDFHATLDALLVQAMDPNYVAPKPWEGEPLTPKPADYDHLLELADSLHAGYRELVREVIELHGPKPSYVQPDGTCYWRCEGCEISGYDAEHPDWPCETTVVIGRHLGVELAP